jgi:hypothetical protein
MEQGKIILLNEPGKIITPRPVPEANPIIGRKQARPVEEIAKKKFEELNEEDKKKIQEQFESRFGKDRAHRTREQWLDLVSSYGIAQVCKIEKMTEKQVRRILKVNKSTQLTKK